MLGPTPPYHSSQLAQPTDISSNTCPVPAATSWTCLSRMTSHPTHQSSIGPKCWRKTSTPMWQFSTIMHFYCTLPAAYRQPGALFQLCTRLRELLWDSSFCCLLNVLYDSIHPTCGLQDMWWANGSFKTFCEFDRMWLLLHAQPTYGQVYQQWNARAR